MTSGGDDALPAGAGSNPAEPACARCGVRQHVIDAREVTAADFLVTSMREASMHGADPLDATACGFARASAVLIAAATIRVVDPATLVRSDRTAHAPG